MKKFEEINGIDVSKRVEQKGGLSYLSWAWAWAEMKKIDEGAKVEVHEFAHYFTIGDQVIQIMKPYLLDDGGAWVKVSVTLNGRIETELLPVMDFRNRSLVKPNSMDLNKAHKRCFVKALALHGLGLYIYAGEDLPEGVEQEEKTTKKSTKANKPVDDPFAGDPFSDPLIGTDEAMNIKGYLKKLPNKNYEQRMFAKYGITKIEDLTQEQYTEAVRYFQSELTHAQAD